jgi:hypothetical protein
MQNIGAGEQQAGIIMTGVTVMDTTPLNSPLPGTTTMQWGYRQYWPKYPVKMPVKTPFSLSPIVRVSGLGLSLGGTIARGIGGVIVRVHSN